MTRYTKWIQLYVFKLVIPVKKNYVGKYLPPVFHKVLFLIVCFLNHQKGEYYTDGIIDRMVYYSIFRSYQREGRKCFTVSIHSTLELGGIRYIPFVIDVVSIPSHCAKQISVSNISVLKTK